MLRKAQRRIPPPASAFSGIVGRGACAGRNADHRDPSAVYPVGPRAVSRRLFDDAKNRSEIVATFLAVLELSKTRRILLEGDGGIWS